MVSVDNRSEMDAQIGQTLVELRDCMSQQNLANAMRERGHKWSQGTVWKVEQGERPLRYTEALDLGEILGIDSRRLVDGSLAVKAERHYRRFHSQARSAVLKIEEGVRELLQAQAALGEQGDIGKLHPETTAAIQEVTPEAALSWALDVARGIPDQSGPRFLWNPTL